jgi:glycosyltransferase involved in cell wall biosynthesis
MKPLVSVVLCSYNQGRYVTHAVESVLGQTYPNWELLVLDNGSTDDTRSRLAPYRSDARVQLLLHDENQPVTRRLNQAIAASRGELVSLLYSDDYYLPKKLERQVECFLRLGPDYGVVYSPGYRLDVRTGRIVLDSSLKVSGDVLEALLLRHTEGFINPISPLVRRGCFDRYPFHEDLFVEGESINLRFAMTFKFFFLDEPLVVMREHDTNIGKAIKANIDRLMIVLDRLERDPDLPPSSRSSVAIFRSRILRDAGWQGVRVVGDRNWARECYRRAVAVDPRQRFHPRVVVGRALTHLPDRWRRLLNGIGDRVRGRSGAGYVERPDIEVR